MDGTSYAPILHLYQRYGADKYQAFYFDFGEPEMFTDVAVLEANSINTNYISDSTFGSTMTQFALLSENRVLTVTATLDSSTDQYTLSLLDAMTIGWSTANPIDFEKANRLVYFVGSNNGTPQLKVMGIRPEAYGSANNMRMFYWDDAST